MIEIHEMGLMLRYMEKIRRGKKIIEMRLKDKKRQAIRPGDHILFYASEDNSVTLAVEVLGVRTFPSFKELYEYYPKNVLGYEKDEPADYRDMFAIYPEERVERFGALAIEVRVI